MPAHDHAPIDFNVTRVFNVFNPCKRRKPEEIVEFRGYFSPIAVSTA
jgi:hypothetical protein